MKKLSALLLALLLAATLCFGAMAETVNYVGNWYLYMLQSGETVIDPGTMGMELTLVLNADYTCTLSDGSSSETGVWAEIEGGVAMTDASGATENLMYVDGTLVLSSDGIDMIFAPGEAAEYASVLANLTLADFNGTWVLEHVEATFGTFGVEDLGANMTIVLADGTASVDMVTDETTEHYDGICELEEAEDLGTIMWLSFLDATTGEPDGTGMMILLYDDGQLVWYEYDSDYGYEYYYCFDLVVEEAE
nr:hypothetical protein [Clostridia bacterium]